MVSSAVPVSGRLSATACGVEDVPGHDHGRGLRGDAARAGLVAIAVSYIDRPAIRIVDVRIVLKLQLLLL